MVSFIAIDDLYHKNRREMEEVQRQEEEIEEMEVKPITSKTESDAPVNLPW